MPIQLLADNEIVFEGLSRPAVVAMFHDGAGDGALDYARDGVPNEKDIAVLERYFADIQNLFLKKFAIVVGSEEHVGRGDAQAALAS